MKTILELQQEIRSLRNDISKMDTNLAMIESELNSMQQEKIRKATGGNQGIEFDYDSFQKLASNLPFVNHVLSTLKEEYPCKLYLKCLLSLVWIDEDAAVEKLTYVQWIYGKTVAVQGVSLEDLYKDSVQLDKTYFLELVELLPQKYRGNLVVDSLVVAELSGTFTKESLQFVGNLCGILGVNREKLNDYSIIAKILLNGNKKKLQEKEGEIVFSNQNILNYYIGFKEMNMMLDEMRNIVFKESRMKMRDFEWKVRQNRNVKEGDVIASYKMSTMELGSSNNGNKGILAAWAARYDDTVIEVKATSSGTLFQLELYGVIYGVISKSYDTKDAVKEWVKKKREMELKS